MHISRKKLELILAFLIASLFGFGTQANLASANPAPFQDGHVFAGVGDGLVQHYDATGNLLGTLDTGKGSGVFTTGCAFDSAGNFYVTTFNGGGVTKFKGPEDAHTNLGSFGSGYSGNPESIVFDAVGNVYVGSVDGDNDIRKFDAEGNPVAKFEVATEDRGSDWIDLASDQRTIFYTSEGRRILRYDVSGAGTQLSDFGTLPGTVNLYALRLLPPGDGTGGLLVADTIDVKRLDGEANVVQTYDVDGENSWFSLNLDPDGKSFWAGNFDTGKFYKFDIAEGGDPLLTVDTGVGATRLFGICVYEEETAALKDMDEDGLLDEWEENGFDLDGDGPLPRVDLPGMGAKKDRKDIFVYIDWIEETGDHGHRPHVSTIDEVVKAFSEAPVDLDGPDLESGINLHVVFGHMIEETAGTDGNRELGSAVADCAYSWGEFAILKDSNFPLQMWPIFHYVIFGHDLPFIPCLGGRPSGVSRNGSDFQDGASDFIVALRSWEQSLSDDELAITQAGTFMHELGHNLGLGHGGLILDGKGEIVDADHTPYKPNYLSVMNYSFQTVGLRMKDSEGVFRGGNFDYSQFGSDDLPVLVEIGLSEPDGLRAAASVKDYATVYYCQGTNEPRTVDGLQQAINWNCNADEEGNDIIDTGLVSTDINRDEIVTDITTGGLSTVNEWPHLQYKGGAIGIFGVTAELPEVTSMDNSPELTFEQDQEIGHFAAKQVDIDIKPGSDPNSINCNGNDRAIAVAILTTDDFDAITVDHTTVTFEGASEIHADKKSGEPRRHEEDIDDDGDTDLVLHFQLGDTALTCESAEGMLMGETFDGIAIKGVDIVRMIYEVGGNP